MQGQIRSINYIIIFMCIALQGQGNLLEVLHCYVFIIELVNLQLLVT